MSNYLVTGGAGFIGSHLCKKLSEEGNRVVALTHDIVPSRWLKEALGECVRVRGDVRDFLLLRRIINQYDISQCVHLAARANVKQAFKDPLGVYDVNVMGTVAMLEACRQLEVDKVLMLETDKVYGEKMDATTDDRLEASEPYATSKVCQQYAAESYIKTYGMNILIPHSCNTFGYDPHNSRIFTNTIKACLKGKSPLIFTNDNTIREYIYIDDLMDALKTLAGDYNQGSYNIATGWVYDQEQIVLKVLEYFPDLEPKYVEVELPPQIQRQTMKITKWNWKPKWDFDNAIEQTISDFETYKDWM